MLSFQNTPIETYSIGKKPILVKREDLCLAPDLGAPPFAKIRGLYEYIKTKKEEGILYFGYVDTSISMAGWGISFICKSLGVVAVLYYPAYKYGEYRKNQSEYIPKWHSFEAIIIPLKTPTQRQINIHRAKNEFFDKYPKNSHFLPDGLNVPQTINAVAKEVPSIQKYKIKTLVVCAGSGVMCAAILKGLFANDIFVDTIIAVPVNTSTDRLKLKKKILNLAGLTEHAGFIVPNLKSICKNFNIVDGGYVYEMPSTQQCPFPSNHYYDLKAWEWLTKNIKICKAPVLFWNIGEGTDFMKI